jgi:hypothetical protein
MLGGSILAALAGSATSGRREATRLLVGLNSWAISLAITFGIAPLLFLQVIHGRFFYTATLLLPWFWLGLLGILTLAYYLNYVAKFRLREGGEARGVLVVVAVCFVAIAAIQVAVNLLHMQPGRWPHVADRTLVAFTDPAFLPRLLHFLLAAMTTSGALLAWLASRRAERGGDRDACDGMARFGVRVALITTVMQILAGFWLLLVLPRAVLRAFMRGSMATLAPLTLGIVASLLLLVVLAQLKDPLAQGVKTRRALEIIVATTALMVVTRHQLRELYLGVGGPLQRPEVAPQWGPFALFLAAFLGCLALTFWGVIRAAREARQQVGGGR